MTSLYIVGAGGHGRVVADTALATGLWQTVFFLDDQLSGTSIIGFPVIGDSGLINSGLPEGADVAIAIGNAGVRLQLIRQAAASGCSLPAIIHPSAVVSRYSSVGRGCVIFAQATIQAGATLGLGCIINTSATVDHDCRLGDGVHVCPGAHIAGNVAVGDLTWIGVGSAVRDGIVIGARVVVGAGAAVVRDINDDRVVMGVPASFRGESR